MSAVNETLIRDVVADVLARLGGAPAASQSAAAPKSDCGCGGKSASSSAPGLRGKFGVFSDANEACVAAHEAFQQLQKAGVAARAAQTADAVTRSFVGQTVAAMEKTLILDTLSHCLGNRTHAANILGISIRTLRNKLNQYDDEGFAVPPPQAGVAAA